MRGASQIKIRFTDPEDDTESKDTSLERMVFFAVFSYLLTVTLGFALLVSLPSYRIDAGRV